MLLEKMIQQARPPVVTSTPATAARFSLLARSMSSSRPAPINRGFFMFRHRLRTVPARDRRRMIRYNRHTLTPPMERHDNIVPIGLHVRLPLTRSLPLFHSDPLPSKLELIEHEFWFMRVPILRHLGQFLFGPRNQSVQIILLGVQLPQALTFLLPPEQHADQLPLAGDVQQGELMREPRPNLECVHRPIFPQDLVFLQRLVDSLADALRVDDSRDIERVLVERIRVLRGNLVHVAHVSAVLVQVGRAYPRLVREEIGYGGMGEAGEGETERAIAFAVHGSFDFTVGGSGSLGD